VIEAAAVRRLAQPSGELTREGGLDDPNGERRLAKPTFSRAAASGLDAATCAGRRSRDRVIRDENADPRRAGNLSL
jgi:hypothetical protein